MRLPFARPGDSGEAPKPIDAAVAALRFEGPARELLHRYKFARALHLRADLADYLEAAVMAGLDSAAVDAVLPLPIRRLHRWDRGYDQSVYLARDLARRIDRRCGEGVLARMGSPKRQSSLPAAEREENVRGTIVVRRPGQVRGRTILVVDDIMTTGATLSECARVLKESGVARVWCATVARV